MAEEKPTASRTTPMDIENVMVAGQWRKRGGKLTFDAGRLGRLNEELLASRLRMFEEGDYRSNPVQRGPRPGRWMF